jgi:hypothetical protein
MGVRDLERSKVFYRDVIANLPTDAILPSN